MPANKYALLRYRIIDRCIANKYKPYPNKEALRRACEEELYGSDGDRVSASTVDKDLYAMRFESNLGYYAPIAYSKVHKGYYYTDPDYSIDRMPLSPDEIEAIHLAASTLRQFRSIELFKNSEAAIDKILDRLSLHPTGSVDDTARFVHFETAPLYRGSEYLPSLLTAIRNREEVTLAYEKYTGSKQRSYTLHPYLLKEYRNRWYVIGYNPVKGDVVTFGLDRIAAVPAPTGLRFEVQADFDADLFFRHSIGITAIHDTPERIHLRFTPLAGKYVESQPLHHSQRILRNDEVALEVELYLCITRELLMLILSYGADVEVKGPESLRRAVVQQLEAAVKPYRI